jgi:hypothetical protein
VPQVSTAPDAVAALGTRTGPPAHGPGRPEATSTAVSPLVAQRRQQGADVTLGIRVRPSIENAPPIISAIGGDRHPGRSCR